MVHKVFEAVPICGGPPPCRVIVGGMAPIPITVDARLRLPLATIPEAVADDLRARCAYPNPDRDRLGRLASRDARLRFRLRSIPPAIETWEQHVGGEFSLPRGAMGKLRSALRAAGLTWTVQDKRTLGGTVGSLGWEHRHAPDPDAPDGGALRDYQEEAVVAAIAKQNCLVRAPTGSGKTTTAIALLARLNLRTLVIVWTGGLLDQWKERLQRELALGEDDVGLVGQGKWKVRDITVAMQQTLAAAFKRGDPRVLDLARYCGVVICDEVQRFAADTFLSVVDRFPAQYRIGFSADETRSDGKEFLIYDLFGSVAHEVSQDELIDAGAVLNVECRVVPTDFCAPWYTAQLQDGIAPDFNRLLDEMSVDAERNALVVQLAAQEAAAGEQVIVLSQRVEHAQRIDAALSARGVRTGIMLGGDDWKSRFDEARAGLRDGTVRAVAGTIQAVGTGIDIPSLSRGVLATPIGSNRQLYGQIRGRLSRPGKSDSVLYVLWDRHVQGRSALKRLVSWNRTCVVRDDDGAWVNGRAWLKQLEDGNGTQADW